MPAFLTHWHVLIETARRSQDAGRDVGSLIADPVTLRRRARGWVTPPQTTPTGAVWDTGPLPEINFRFPGSDISAMAYLGALAPDITAYQKGSFKQKITGKQTPAASDHMPWATLLHRNQTGDVLITFLELIAAIPSPALRSQALAFAMGYLSHIATDLALHPCVNTLAAAFLSGDIRGARQLDPHFYVELCLDEYIASTHFDQPRYNRFLGNQPWGLYIEPAARNFALQKTLSAQILDQFTHAIEITYSLTEAQAGIFRQDYLAGLQRLRRFLGGRDIFRSLALYALTRNRARNRIIGIIETTQAEPGTTTFAEVITYAVRLSERFCRHAMSFYAALRNPNASAGERRQKRTQLRADLRNWNLDSGYALGVTLNEEITIQLIHNWVHFGELWNRDEASGVEPPRSLAN